MSKIKYYLLILIIFAFAKTSISQLYKPYTKNFTPKQYGDTCNSQNWSISQNTKGILYFGNDKRLLKFDGENWDNIRTSLFGGFASALYTDKQGNFFVGLNGEFGQIKLDSLGREIYVSLSSNLNDEDAFFSNIWRIFEYNNSVLFFSEEKIFLYKDDKISVINPQTSFHLAFIVNNQLFVRQREIGLMKFENNKFSLVQNGDIFKDYGVFGIFPTSQKQQYLIITQELGAFNYYTNKTDSAIIPINNLFKSQLINANIFGGISLTDGKIALNTSQNGVLIINYNAQIENIINTSTGIKDNDVKQVFQDSNNDLWLAMNTGICRVNYSSQISNFNSSSKLTGDVLAVARYNDKLYAGTNDGLFVFNSSKQLFEKLKDFNKQIHQLTVVLDKLIISSEIGLFQIKGNSSNKISNIERAKFYFLKDKNILFVAGKNKIEIYNNQDYNWKLKTSIKNIFLNDITNIEYNKEIDDSLDFWIGTINTELWNIKLSNNFKTSKTIYNYSDGINSGWITPLKTNGKLLFGSSTGLLKFVNGKTLDQHDTTNTKYKGYFEPADYLGLENDAISTIQEEHSKVWICKNGSLIFYNTTKNKLDSIYFTGIDIGKINNLYPNKSNIFICGNDGITYVNLEKYKDFNTKITVNIRKVITDNNDILYYGNSDISENKQVLDYKNNSISFSFASLYLENGKSANYSYIIEGYDDKWSDWSTENIAKYKKLPPRDYVFKVKARNLYGIESNIAEYKFSITPPFYLTTWAYIIYAILILLLLWLFIKLYTRKLEKDKQRLEEIIKERTIEISEKKDEIEAQHHKILEIHTELTDSINYAQRIQQAVLPSDNYLDTILDDYFILFKPKDVVSGDFYWATKINEHIIIAAADCTGHGVPGAFMSMLGTSFLNEIVRNTKIIKANEILVELRKSVIDALQQTGEEGEQKDGMDISLCTINTHTQEVQWAGAYNPLYIIKGNKENDSNILAENDSIKTFSLTPPSSFNLYEVKPDKMPIAIYIKMDEFTNNVFKLQKGDKLYMFSDGYADQFGGPKGKKFKYKPFKNLLLENSNKPMSEQKEILTKAFKDWQSGYEQIDDVVVLGIKL